MSHNGAVLIAALVASGALGGCRRSPRSPPPVNKARLVVLVVVNQLPTWSFVRDVAHLDGGFERLITRGAYYSHGEIPYGSSFTAPGHAALATGACPDKTGVVGNYWYDRGAKRPRSASADTASPIHWLPRVPATKPVGGASGATLLVEGVGDVLRRETAGGGRAVAIGLKQRAAVFVLGQKPDLALWYDAAQPAITTSELYTSSPPEWLQAFAAAEPSPALLDLSWTPLSEKRLAAITQTADDAPGESSIHGLGTTFPHDVGKTATPSIALRATPAGTELVFAAARAAIEGEELGTDDTPDILAITLSSHDYAGHYWGQESWERLDLLLRLDHSLGIFLDYLDERIGAGSWAMVVTSDHGATRIVERSGPSARRIPVSELLAAAQQAAESAAGPGDWVAEFAANTIYMSNEFNSLPPNTQKRGLEAAERRLRAVAGVKYAKLVDRIRGDCDARAGLDALACRAVHPDRSGELYVATEEHCVTSRGYTAGTSHGSANPDDRFVPIIVFEPDRPPKTIHEPTSLLRVAPTLSRLLAIPPPNAATLPAL